MKKQGGTSLTMEEQPNTPRRKEEPAVLSGMYVVNICIFLLMILGIGLAAVLLPKPTVSEQEKRELAKPPAFSLSTLFSGEFTKQFDLFYADTFPGRDSLVSFAAKMEEMRGIRPDDVRIHESKHSPEGAVTPGVQEPSSQETTPGESSPNNNEPAPGNGLAPDDGSVQGEQLGAVYLYRNMAMSLFGGNKTVASRYAQTINQYAQQLGSDVQIYNLVAPTAAAYYLPEKHKDLSADQKENIDSIYSQLSPGIKTVDAYSAIEQVKDQYVYFRSDHHWTVRGAYAAYTAFCKEAGFAPVPLSEMERHQIDNFVGTLYNETQDSKLKETPDFVEYFVPPVECVTTRYVRNQPFTPIDSTIFASYATEGPNTYSVFLHGDFPLTDIKTNLNTGRKALIVKESFGNAFAPFLASHYDEVFIVDQRYFQLGLIDFIKEKGVTDLLFVNNIFAANTEVRVNEIARIANQTYVPYVPKPKPAPEPEPEKVPEETEEIPQEEAPQEELEEDIPEEEEKPKKIISPKNKEAEEACDEWDWEEPLE